MKSGSRVRASRVVAAGATAEVPAPDPSAASLAFAQTFLTFDAALSASELHAIARAIDESRAHAAALNSKTRPLRNSDEMAVRFSAADRL